jgi:hypothetical protein
VKNPPDEHHGGDQRAERHGAVHGAQGPEAEGEDAGQGYQGVGEDARPRAELHVVEARALIGRNAVGIARQAHALSGRVSDGLELVRQLVERGIGS